MSYTVSYFFGITDKVAVSEKNDSNEGTSMRITDSVTNDAGTEQNIAPALASNNTASTQYNNFYTKKKFIQLSVFAMTGIALLGIPAKSNSVMSSQTGSPHTPNQTFDKVMKTKKLTLAAVKGDTTFFAIDGFEHGFGYDLARSYANKLNVEIELKTFKNPKTALAAVSAGQVDMALTTASNETLTQMSLASVNLSCGRDAKLTSNGLHPKVSWTFANANDQLAKSASHYVCDTERLDQTKKLASFYNQELLRDAYNKMHFEKSIAEKLPLYQNSFKKYAEQFNHDWELLVAMGYQESHLKANAVSRTGVQGIMMLTKNTAYEMGIRNRTNPNQSILGAARYLAKLKKQFSDVPKSDRIWFALASYNMGPYAVEDIQHQLREAGKNDKRWEDVYEYMSNNTQNNGRYVQCMHYVTNIRSYLEAIKFQGEADKEEADILVSAQTM